MTLRDEELFTARAEGLRLMPYRCPAGKLTIGWGHNIEDNGISLTIAEQLLREDLANARKELSNNFVWLASVSYVWQEILTDMCFNLGITRLKTMKRFLSALAQKDYNTALAEMIDSAWFEQVGCRSKMLFVAGVKNIHLETAIRQMPDNADVHRIFKQEFTLWYYRWQEDGKPHSARALKLASLYGIR